ncbi:MAG TPA: hypothetical protein VK927_03035 [Adhaeribacter sp.]|nr:hypothetical protein [Adhaeribacter sp.]
MEIVFIHDLKNPETGNSYKEDNLAKQHNIPVGTLVQINSDMEEYDGIRLFVVGHHRDCDGTPLYSLGKKGEEMYDNGGYFPGAKPGTFHNPKTMHGFSEDSLLVINKSV